MLLKDVLVETPTYRVGDRVVVYAGGVGVIKKIDGHECVVRLDKDGKEKTASLAAIHPLKESAPHSQEEWVKRHKKEFRERYGKKVGDQVLYSIAWKRAKLTEAVNHLGEREYETYAGWKRAIKKLYPTAVFIGDIDIGEAHVNGKSVGEWDGAVGCIYTPKLHEATAKELDDRIENLTNAIKEETPRRNPNDKGDTVQYERHAKKIAEYKAELKKLKAERKSVTEAVDTLSPEQAAAMLKRMDNGTSAAELSSENTTIARWYDDIAHEMLPRYHPDDDFEVMDERMYDRLKSFAGIKESVDPVAAAERYINDNAMSAVSEGWESGPQEREPRPERDPDHAYDQARQDKIDAEVKTAKKYYVYDGVQRKAVSGDFDDVKDAIAARDSIKLNKSQLSIQTRQIRITEAANKFTSSVVASDDGKWYAKVYKDGEWVTSTMAKDSKEGAKKLGQLAIDRLSASSAKRSDRAAKEAQLAQLKKDLADLNVKPGNQKEADAIDDIRDKIKDLEAELGASKS